MTDNEKNIENEVESPVQAEVSSEPATAAAVEPVVSAAESPLKNKKQLPNNGFMKVLLFIWAKLKQFGLAVWDGLKHIPYCCYCLSHPFEGFFRMKEDKRKQSVAAAIILYAFLVFSAIAVICSPTWKFS